MAATSGAAAAPRTEVEQLGLRHLMFGEVIRIADDGTRATATLQYILVATRDGADGQRRGSHEGSYVFDFRTDRRRVAVLPPAHRHEQRPQPDVPRVTGPAGAGDTGTATATALVEALQRREVGSVELLVALLERIERLDPAVNAVVTTDIERAMGEARAADAAIAEGRVLGRLHGLPMTVKDCLATAGMRTTAGATELRDYVPDEDATSVARLRAAGAIVVGKTNLPAWAGDCQTYNELFGTTNNPWDVDAHRGRLVGRRRCRGGDGDDATRARQRPRRLHPHPRPLLRRLRAQADVRHRPGTRPHPAATGRARGARHRCRRPARPQRRRPRARARRARRSRRGGRRRLAVGAPAAARRSPHRLPGGGPARRPVLRRRFRGAGGARAGRRRAACRGCVRRHRVPAARPRRGPRPRAEPHPGRHELRLGPGGVRPPARRRGDAARPTTRRHRRAGPATSRSGPATSVSSPSAASTSSAPGSSSSAPTTCC